MASDTAGSRGVETEPDYISTVVVEPFLELIPALWQPDLTDKSFLSGITHRQPDLKRIRPDSEAAKSLDGDPCCGDARMR